MPTVLPPNEPAAPVQGQPGHFAWSNWIMQAVKNLDAGTMHSAELNGRNKIINGDFSVNQRAFTSFSGAGSNAFGFDRWYLSSGGNGTHTTSTQTPALGDLPESPRAFYRNITTGQSATSDYASIVQKIESVRTLSGKTATVSFWAKAGSGTPKVSLEMAQSFGTGGSPSAVVNTYGGQVTLSTTWTRYSLTVAIPSITGKVLGTGGNDALLFNLWISGGSDFNSRTGSLGIQSNTFDIWGVQVEEGSIATAYEQKSYAAELRDCQRYFARIYASNSNGRIGIAWGSTTVGAFAQIPLPVPMRTPPQCTWVSGSIAVDDRTGSILPATGSSADPSSSTTIGHLNLTFTAGIVAGRVYELMGYSSPTGSIDCNAEL